MVKSISHPHGTRHLRELVDDIGLPSSETPNGSFYQTQRSAQQRPPTIPNPSITRLFQDPLREVVRPNVNLRTRGAGIPVEVRILGILHGSPADPDTLEVAQYQQRLGQELYTRRNTVLGRHHLLAENLTTEFRAELSGQLLERAHFCRALFGREFLTGPLPPNYFNNTSRPNLSSFPPSIVSLLRQRFSDFDSLSLGQLRVRILNVVSLGVEVYALLRNLEVWESNGHTIPPNQGVAIHPTTTHEQLAQHNERLRRGEPPSVIDREREIMAGGMMNIFFTTHPDVRQVDLVYGISHLPSIAANMVTGINGTLAILPPASHSQTPQELRFRSVCWQLTATTVSPPLRIRGIGPDLQCQ